MRNQLDNRRLPDRDPIVDERLLEKVQPTRTHRQLRLQGLTMLVCGSLLFAVPFLFPKILHQPNENGIAELFFYVTFFAGGGGILIASVGCLRLVTGRLWKDYPIALKIVVGIIAVPWAILVAATIGVMMIMIEEFRFGNII